MQELPKPIQLVKDRLQILYDTQFASFMLYRDLVTEAVDGVRSSCRVTTGTLRSLSLEELQQAKLYADELWNWETE